MLGVAAFVVTADAVSKALVLRDLPGRPPVRLLDGLLTPAASGPPGRRDVQARTRQPPNRPQRHLLQQAPGGPLDIRFRHQHLRGRVTQRDEAIGRGDPG